MPSSHGTVRYLCDPEVEEMRVLDHLHHDLGNVILPGRLEVSAPTIDAIRNFKASTNVTEI